MGRGERGFVEDAEILGLVKYRGRELKIVATTNKESGKYD